MNGGINLINNILNLNNIINAINFQKIQNAISEVTGMSLLAVDYKGTPVTKHSNCSGFCKIIRVNYNYSKLCEKCDSRGGLEAARLQQPYVYKCHMGLLVFAIPLIVDDQYLGALVGGQILLKEDYEKKILQRIFDDKIIKVELANKKEIEEEYKKIKIISMDRFNSVAKMIFLISNYIVEEALLKIELNEMNVEILMLNTGKNIKNIDISKGKESEKVFSLINTLNKEIYKNDIEIIAQSKEELFSNKNNLILRPALEYIENNYCKTISLDDMASLCNISSSYFSKLFKKIIGENFSYFVNKLRIKRAKVLLETTDIPCINISIDLGFENCGYFIKVFKKIVGFTPLAYRQQHSLQIMKYNNKHLNLH